MHLLFYIAEVNFYSLISLGRWCLRGSDNPDTDFNTGHIVPYRAIILFIKACVDFNSSGFHLLKNKAI